MRRAGELWERVRSLRHRRALERELDEELAGHLEMAVQEHLQGGMSPEEARRAAHVQLGGRDQAREGVRDERAIPWIEPLLRDARYACRTFWRESTLTLTVVAALTIGIGGNTAVFSLVDTVLLKPIPVPDPDRLVMLTMVGPQGEGPAGSEAAFNHWRAQTDVLADVAAFRPALRNYVGGETSEQIVTAEVTEAYFRCFGVSVATGRSFTPREARPGGPPVALLSSRFWTRAFNADPDILGRTILLSGIPHTVIGVVGAGFDPGELKEFRRPPEVYAPLRISPDSAVQRSLFRVAARLLSGVTLAQARERLAVSTRAFHDRFPGALPGLVAFGASGFLDVVVGGSRRGLWMLLGAVGCVLLIACANVANLLLTRASGRDREMAIRRAIGAGRARLIQQALVESVLLSAAGGALGLALGQAGIHALLAVNTAGLPRVGEAGMLVVLDWRVLAFTLTVSVVTGVAFGLIPALAGSRVDANLILKDAGERTARAYHQSRTRSLLVAAEVALAVVLLTGALLLIRTEVATAAIDPGFDPRNGLTMRMSLDEPGNATEGRLASTLDRLGSLPGVESATVTCGSCLPLQFGFTLPFEIVGRPLPNPRRGPSARWVVASSRYFDVFDVPLKGGRFYDEGDTAATPAVVLINERMRQMYWPGGTDPVGQRLIVGRGRIPEFAEEPEREIVGIVGDVPDGGLHDAPTPRVYVPFSQLPERAAGYVFGTGAVIWAVRTRGNPYALAPAMRQELLDSMGLPVASIASVEDYVGRSISSQRFNLLLMTVFAAAAVVLAAIGIFGVVAYSVRQRTHEIGIRLALGAGAGRVRTMALRQGMGPTLAGVAIGLGASYWLVQFLASQLYEVEPRDPLVFVAVPLLVVAVALAAIWIPARRASRVDPIRALRFE